MGRHAVRHSSSSLTRAELALRKRALAYPESYEEFPWDHRAIKVKGKIFLIMARQDGTLSLSLKLPLSAKLALGLPFAKPTEYGLGKSGWVTARFTAKDKVPLEMLEEWIDESFRAIAPKRLVASLEHESAQKSSPPTKRRSRQPRQKK